MNELYFQAPTKNELTLLMLDDVDTQAKAQPTLLVGGSMNDALRRLNLSYDDMVRKGVIESYEIPPTILFKRSIGYQLAGKFAAYSLVSKYSDVDNP